MRTILSLLGLGLGGFVLGQVDTGIILKDAASLTGTTAVILALGYLLKFYIPSLHATAAVERAAFTATLDKMADRHDNWEKVRHEDSETLHATIMAMTKNCAEAQAVMRGVPNKPSGS